MGVDKAIRARTVTDEGIKFVDANNKPYASFPATSDTASLVREIEILRGDMADVFYQATKSETEYIFDDRITALNETPQGTTVEFKNSPARTFDLVIAADGLSGRTREIAFGKSKDAAVKNLNQWVALFMVPHAPADGTWSRALIAPRGRVLCLRPDIARHQTSVYLCQGTEDMSIVALDEQEQKALIQRTFEDAGWEAERVLGHMADARNFYVQQVAQVKMDSWVRGRVALLGDAGYCPAPVSGLGTTMALVGAYVLAGCLTTHEDDLAKGLERYEREMRPFVESAQQLGPGVPGIATPHSDWGVWTLRNSITTVGFVLEFVRATGLAWLLGWVFWPFSFALRRVGRFGGVQSMPLPVYEKMKGFA